MKISSEVVVGSSVDGEEDGNGGGGAGESLTNGRVVEVATVVVLVVVRVYVVINVKYTLDLVSVPSNAARTFETKACR